MSVLGLFSLGSINSGTGQLNTKVKLAGKNSDVLLAQKSSQLIIESCQVSWTEF